MSTETVDEANHQIQSFNPSEALAHSLTHQSSPHYGVMAAPAVDMHRQPNTVALSTAREPRADLASVPSSGLFSPTQLSGQAETGPIVPQHLKEHETVTPRYRKERTPLRPHPDNQAFRLSSSPVEPSPLRKRPADDIDKDTPVISDTDDFEVIEAVRPRTATPASRQRRPEIILQSKSASRARSRIESPDPLDIIPNPSASTSYSRPQQPRSSATESTGVGSERKSSRVQAATEKKELEKEEKRRIRRERKAREEEERKAKTADQATKSKRQKKTDSLSTATRRSTASPRKSESAAVGEIPDPTPASEIVEVPAEIAKSRLTDTSGGVGARASISQEPEDIHAPASVAIEPAVLEDEVDLVDAQVPKSPIKSAAKEFLRHDDALPPAESPPHVHESRQRERVASTSSSRDSPGPAGPDGRLQRPQGIRWQTCRFCLALYATKELTDSARDDLSGVLAKFGGARPTGMSKRHRIAPLHAKIGPPAKALPPVPQKPVKRKKGDESEEEESDDGDGEEDQDGAPKRKSKVKGMEWFMVED